MTPKTFELPIVGLFHHPPAMGLSRLLPLNTNLWLRSEPTNAYDSNAIAVDLDIDLLNLTHKAALRREIIDLFNHYRTNHPDGLRFEEDVEPRGTFHLGYISAVDALNLRTNYVDFDILPGFLRFEPPKRAGGQPIPIVRFAIKEPSSP